MEWPNDNLGSKAGAEFFDPLLLRPDYSGPAGKAEPYSAHLPFRVILPAAV